VPQKPGTDRGFQPLRSRLDSAPAARVPHPSHREGWEVNRRHRRPFRSSEDLPGKLARWGGSSTPEGAGAFRPLTNPNQMSGFSPGPSLFRPKTRVKPPKIQVPHSTRNTTENRCDTSYAQPAILKLEVKEKKPRPKPGLFLFADDIHAQPFEVSS
jgi:hypothetical protein